MLIAVADTALSLEADIPLGNDWLYEDGSDSGLTQRRFDAYNVTDIAACCNSAL